LSSLRATSRPVSTSRAAYTCAMPPSPTVPSTRKRPPTSWPSSTARSATAPATLLPSSRARRPRSTRTRPDDPGEQERRDDEERGPRRHPAGEERLEVPSGDHARRSEGHGRERDDEERDRARVRRE